MKSAAKRKIIVPTLEERVHALLEELEEALDELAEQRRPKGELKSTTVEGVTEVVGSVPREAIRRLLNARGYGDCACKTYLAGAFDHGHWRVLVALDHHHALISNAWNLWPTRSPKPTARPGTIFPPGPEVGTSTVQFTMLGRLIDAH